MIRILLVSDTLLKYVDSLIIDSDLQVTPYRVISSDKVVYTDHYSVLLKLKNLPTIKSLKKSTKSKSTRWNTNKEGGWAAYENLTTGNEVLDNIASNGDDVNKLEIIINKELKNVKYKAFGKITYHRSTGSDNDGLSLTSQ